MCAINPKHKKRMVFDFYTSQPMEKSFFDKEVINWCLETEVYINQHGKIRCHVKESKQEAD